MWANDRDLARAVAAEMVKLLRAPEPGNAVLPALPPPPFKPEKAPKYETDQEQMLRRARDDVRAGRAVSASMSRPRPQPPRGPGRQQQATNGIWSWWK